MSWTLCRLSVSSKESTGLYYNYINWLPSFPLTLSCVWPAMWRDPAQARSPTGSRGNRRRQHVGRWSAKDEWNPLNPSVYEPPPCPPPSSSFFLFLTNKQTNPLQIKSTSITMGWFSGKCWQFHILSLMQCKSMHEGNTGAKPPSLTSIWLTSWPSRRLSAPLFPRAVEQLRAQGARGQLRSRADCRCCFLRGC